MRLKDFITNKRVVIVGPSSHIKGMNEGSVIDGYDTVIRMNGFDKILSTEDPNDVGTRTDIVSSHLATNIIAINEWEKHKVKLVYCPHPFYKPFDRNINNFKRVNKDRFPFEWYNSTNNWKQLSRSLKTRPNTGLMTIVKLLELDPKEIYVIGFSFYTTDYISSKYGVVPPESFKTRQTGKHNQLSQQQYFFELLDQYSNLKVDEFLLNMYRGELK